MSKRKMIIISSVLSVLVMALIEDARYERHSLGWALRRTDRIVVRAWSGLYESRNRADIAALEKAVRAAAVDFYPSVNNCLDTLTIELYAEENLIETITGSCFDLTWPRPWYSIDLLQPLFLLRPGPVYAWRSGSYSIHLDCSGSEPIVRWFKDRNIKLCG